MIRPTLPVETAIPTLAISPGLVNKTKCGVHKSVFTVVPLPDYNTHIEISSIGITSVKDPPSTSSKGLVHLFERYNIFRIATGGKGGLKFKAQVLTI